MIVDVGTDGSVALLEAEDTRAFKLVAPHGMTEADLAQVLTGVAEIESNHAWVKQSWILGNSPLAASQDWQGSFAKMLDYARSKNWLRGADEAIRAHIEQK
jgi:hypothetical protein